MSSAEWISLAFFVLFMLAATVAPLESGRRIRAIGLGFVGTLSVGLLQLLEGSPPAGAVRDLTPALLTLIAYRQSGQFFRGGDPRVQAFLRRVDRRWFPSALRVHARVRERPLLSTYLETAYLLCYPLVPLGVGVLYMAGQGDAADRFWTVVLPPTYLCYGVTACFQSLPPRIADAGAAEPPCSSSVRWLNLWILRHAGIRANTIPSAHVASTLAAALVIVGVMPVAGAFFLLIAGSIALSTAILRYHYAVDGVMGAALALLAFGLLG